MNLKLKPFTEKDVAIIESWFDDPDTVKWLGDRKWIENIFRLQSEPVGTEFRGQHRISYHPYIAYDQNEPVGFVDADVVDRYVEYGGEAGGKPVYLKIDDEITASTSFVVNPSNRRQGYGAAMLRALIERPELKAVRIFQAGVEPENTASIKTLEDAGFVSNYQPDFENMYYFLLRR